jgi:glycosyltransferase involved in cell wall biosynthesis
VRHALFVAFHFPPEASSSGVLRTTKYVRYLPERGYRVSVVTADPSAYEVTDASLESQLPAGTRVVRTAFRNTKRHWSWRGIYPALLALPDVWIGWMPFAVRAGRALMREDPVDLVYSTSPHATAHLIAASLARHAGVPWIADFRDPWFEDPPEPGAPNGPVFRNVNRWLERRTIGGASAVVTSTTQLRDMLRRRYPEEPATKIRAILNGYDEADFAEATVAPASRGERLRIVHAGSINAEFRDPRPLFASLARLVREGVLDVHSIELRFIGGGPFGDATEVRQAVADAGLRDAVTFLPRVPYEQSLRELAAADVLLLLQASDDTVSLVPAKLYEYLRAQKPTLAMVREGAVTEVLAQTGGGFAVDPARAESLDAALRSIVADWRSGRLPDRVANRSVLQRFDRRALTGELAAVFDEVCG